MLLAQIIDSAVLRFPKAVTHFSPGSYASRPLQTTSFGNVFMAGDWVKGVPHGANGLSQVCYTLRLFVVYLQGMIQGLD
jgi:uncharacterized protein with NAD-binding domain and iron-sulfur cluster